MVRRGGEGRRAIPAGVAGRSPAAGGATGRECSRVASGGASGRFWSVGMGGSISGRRAAVARQNRAAAAEPYYPRLHSPVCLPD
jgi:hypothetical protein